MANPTITLKQLHYFVTLAEHRHFGRTAEACAISQPALSMQIKELETHLGVALFERSARQVQLTVFGETMAGRAREILQSVDEIGQMARASGEHLVGRLRLGVIPTIAPYLLPAIVDRLSSVNQALDIHVRETQTAKLVEELLAGHLDMAIVALPISVPTLVEVPLFREPFMLVRPESERNKPIPDRDALREMRLLLLEEGHCFRDQALAFCNIQPTSPRETLEASSLSTLVQMVSSGIGVTLIPKMAISIETRSASVSVSRFPDPEPSRQVGMIWRKSSPLSDQFYDVCDMVKSASEKPDPPRD